MIKIAFKQPRVPEYREGDGVSRYIKSLVLFLKDFCMDVWTANRQRAEEIEKLKHEVENLQAAMVVDKAES